VLELLAFVWLLRSRAIGAGRVSDLR
jgi:hypothetical protein